MAEKRLGSGKVEVDPTAQRLIRECTEPYVKEMVDVLVNIARTGSTRDSLKAASLVINYYAKGGEEMMGADGTPMVGVVVVNTSNTREMDEAADELRRLQASVIGRSG